MSEDKFGNYKADNASKNIRVLPDAEVIAGALGSSLITDTASHAGAWRSITAIEDTTFTALIGNLYANGEGVAAETFLNKTLKAGNTLLGKFTEIQLASGSVQAMLSEAPADAPHYWKLILPGAVEVRAVRTWGEAMEGDGAIGILSFVPLSEPRVAYTRPLVSGYDYYMLAKMCPPDPLAYFFTGSIAVEGERNVGEWHESEAAALAAAESGGFISSTIANWDFGKPLPLPGEPR